MIHQERFEKALQSPEPAQALRSLVSQLSSEGFAKGEIYDFFENVLLQLRARGNQAAEEDTVLDVMDALTGWCHPDARLLADQKDT
jgi:hypothetical protein